MTGPTGAEFSNLENLGSALGFVEEIQSVVAKLAVFEGFTLSDYSKLCEYMVCFGARSNVTLLREGAPGDFLLIILTGQVGVSKTVEPSQPKRVTRVGPGSFLGEMSLIDGQARSASCVTTQPTDFAVLSRSRLNALLADHPPLGAKVLLAILQTMTARLRDTTTRMLPAVPGEWV